MLVAYAALKRRSSTVAPAVMVVPAVTVVHAITTVSAEDLLLVFLSCIFFCRLRKQFWIECRIDLDLLEFGGAGRLTVLLVLVLTGHGQAVFRAPVLQVGFAVEGTGLSHRFVFLAENVAGLRIDIPADPGNRATDVDYGGVDVADFLGAGGGEGEGGIVGVLGDVDEIVVQLREHLGFLRRRHTARAHASHAHESVVWRGDDG